jgi:hypothetical protein
MLRGFFRLALLAALAALCGLALAVPGPARADESLTSPPTIGARLIDPAGPLRAKLGLPGWTRGTLIQEVLARGPADAAGLRAGDLIERVDKVAVSGTCSFLLELGKQWVGAKVSITYLRGQARREAVVTLADSVSLSRSACDAKDRLGCEILGEIHALQGEDWATAEAVRLYRRACDLGSAEGCSDLGHAYLDGRGVAADDASALAIFEKACAKWAGAACASYAYLVVSGRATRSESTRLNSSHRYISRMPSSA